MGKLNWGFKRTFPLSFSWVRVSFPLLCLSPREGPLGPTPEFKPGSASHCWGTLDTLPDFFSPPFSLFLILPSFCNNYDFLNFILKKFRITEKLQKQCRVPIFHSASPNVNILHNHLYSYQINSGITLSTKLQILFTSYHFPCQCPFTRIPSCIQLSRLLQSLTVFLSFMTFRLLKSTAQ